jgi:hypothetical protein
VKGTWLRGGARVGARIPLHYAAFMIGVGGGLDHMTLSGLPSWARWNSVTALYGGAWTKLDVQVFCDWAIFGGVNLDLRADAPESALGILVGAAFQPNRVCRAERSTRYELEGRSSAKASPRLGAGVKR